MRIDISTEVDPTVLAEQFGAALHREIAVNARQPGQTDNRGNPLPGVVILLDPTTGTPLADAPGTRVEVEAVLFAHRPPPRPKTVMEQLAEAASTATTLEQLQAAVLEFAQANMPKEQS